MPLHTYHSSLFRTLEDNLQRVGSKHYVLDELDVLE